VNATETGSEISFRQILPRLGGQREAFEELCRQLAGLSAGVSLVRPSRSRGDGASEFYLESASGRRAWQAPYVFDLNPLIRQASESLSTALEVHPNLTEFVLCFPFDPTEPAVPRGRSGQEKLESWKHDRQAEALARGRKLIIDLWPASRLRELIRLHDQADRLRDQFFGSSTTFTVDAALLRELGEQLIGHSHIALAELLKNSYDADATECRIEFRDDEIIVWDNGHGISEQEFHAHWMRLGTTHKTVTRESRGYRRPMTGSKGIGRLSVQFLADEMTLESATVNDASRHLYVFVDWTGVRRGEELNTVNVLWQMRDGTMSLPTSESSGTRIVLKKLRSEWGTEAIEKLGQEIWLLRPPFAAPQVRRTERTGLDFHIDIDAPKILRAREAFDKLQNALFQNWKAKIRGRLRDGRAGGEATIELEFKPSYPEGQEASRSFRERVSLPINAGPAASSGSPCAIDGAKFEILVFKTEGRQPGGLAVGEVREYLRRFGNVSVYDSGFRLPYYGASQDWLNVTRDQGRRLIVSDLLPARLNVEGRYLLDLPAPGRIFGAVEIDTNHERSLAENIHAGPGESLQLSPGRDRLAPNRAFKQLRNLVRFSLDFYASRYRMLAAQSAEKARARESPARTVRRAVVVLDRNRDAMPRAVFRDVRREVVAAEKASKRAEEETDRRAVLLAPLATAGMTALALNHELAREITLVSRLGERLTAVAARLDAPELAEIARSLLEAESRFRSLQELFAPLVSEEDREATDRLRVGPVVESVVRAMRPLMPRVSFEAVDVPEDLRFPVGSFADWNALLQNLLSNAWNAMLDAEKDPSVAFDGGRRGRYQEWFRVSDTGVGLGVPLGEAPALFEPFERRLRVSERNRSVAMGGQGLGLALVRLIASRRSVRAAFVRPRTGFSTSFELSWKGASK